MKVVLLRITISLGDLSVNYKYFCTWQRLSQATALSWSLIALYMFENENQVISWLGSKKYGRVSQSSVCEWLSNLPNAAVSGLR